MKTIISPVVLVLLCCLSSSCHKQELEKTVSPVAGDVLSAFQHMKKYPEQPIQINVKDRTPYSPVSTTADAGKSLDEHKRSDPPNETTVTYVNPVKELINWDAGSYAWEFEANEHVVYSDYEDQIYPGALIKGNSVASFDFNPVIGYTPKPISLSVSLPAPAGLVAGTINVPSLSATTQLVNHVLLNSTFAQGGFSKYNLNIKQFTYYDELKEFFASSKNTNLIFFNSGSSGSTDIKKISRNTGLMAKFIQKNFTVDMDIPKAGQLIDLNVDAGILGAYSPLYVSSVTYGRLGIITVESNASFDELKTAFQKAFGILGVVNSSNTLTQAEINIINGANIKVYLVGGQGAMAVQTMNGYQHFMQYLGGGQTFSPQTPGVPISFSMRYLSDHRPYKAQFQINYGPIAKVYTRIELRNYKTEYATSPFGYQYRVGEYADVHIAFYQDANCTMPTRAYNFVQFNFEQRNRSELNLVPEPPRITEDISNYSIKNELKGTSVLVGAHVRLASYPDYDSEQNYEQFFINFKMLPGEGYYIAK
ncbi:thiol-activated cytolysin family protein [Chitinophaga pendula]|uniref:thiol-activated cytolysin family protein n=1 Tax=Chitinophaga TaxID=79328 RepID=UPI000BAE8890|nr:MULTISPECIES: thiol-activated cytolysin family protein [Chitinophaga]ASZ09803.1 hypothetical protein CK934_01815 [Chitinophaga sp. MD30]UCJ07257.1 thiol-activated cytolysin family protein [Chitinophaga pendula]